MKKTSEFKLCGLNRKPSGNGVYATCELIGKEGDWFHADFDRRTWPIDRQLAFFNYMKSEDQRFGNSEVFIDFDGYSTGGMPTNPIITEIKFINKID